MITFRMQSSTNSKSNFKQSSKPTTGKKNDNGRKKQEHAPPAQPQGNPQGNPQGKHTIFYDGSAKFNQIRVPLKKGHTFTLRIHGDSNTYRFQITDINSQSGIVMKCVAVISAPPQQETVEGDEPALGG